MPKLLTRLEYQKLFHVSRQAVCNQITKKRLRTVMAPLEIQKEMIVLDDDIYEEAVKKNRGKVVDIGKPRE